MQWCELPQVNCVHISIELHQQFCHFIVAIGTSIVQRDKTTGGRREGGREGGREGEREKVQFMKLSPYFVRCTILSEWREGGKENIHRTHPSPLVPRMHISAFPKQELHSCHTVVAGSKVKGGGEPATHVTTVHILRSTQTLERRKYTTSGCSL